MTNDAECHVRDRDREEHGRRCDDGAGQDTELQDQPQDASRRPQIDRRAPRVHHLAHHEHGEDEGIYWSERSYGSFYRQIPLPEDAKTENAAATFRNGVLEITIPAPKAETRSRKLEIKEPAAEKSAKATA